MSTYTEMKQTFSDFQMVAASIGDTKDTLSYLRDAIRRRIEADQTEIRAKISNMEERLTDETMTEPVRRLMESELEKLKQTTFAPSAAEREAYEKEIEALRTAQTDLQGLADVFAETVAEIEAEVAEIKGRMTADTTLTDLPSMIAAERRTFEHLCEEVFL